MVVIGRVYMGTMLEKKKLGTKRSCEAVMPLQHV